MMEKDMEENSSNELLSCLMRWYMWSGREGCWKLAEKVIEVICNVI
jgi:hypothetical protein